ncbi:MAG TPA: hypothetical protein VFO25_00540 [Candidatus Eremiobacteraceae bacterium]|nr:hypothetical protein [Candidatus Eremiobacteraceae bacterium]
MSKLSVTWHKCGDDHHWCSFENLTLDKMTDKGVYVIWHQGNPGKVVYVGQGDVADRITAHRSDKRITKYADRVLRVTWAELSVFQWDGVERYLADRYSPLVGDAHPDCGPIEVNGPWD